MPIKKRYHFNDRCRKDQNQDTEVQFQYGLVLCQLEMFDQAIKQLKIVLSIDSNHVDAIYNLGLATYMKNEDVDEAIEYFNQAIEIDSGHLLSQHALKRLQQLKKRSNTMTDPTLFDYSMIKGTVEAILFQNSDNFILF